MSHRETPVCRPGKSFPLGATLTAGGANFSVFSKHGIGAQLLLFDDVDALQPSRVIDLDPRTNRTYHYWHAFVPGVTAGQSMVTTSPGLSISRGGFVSTPTSYCSTPTADASPGRRVAAGSPLAMRATTPPPRSGAW